MFGSTQASKPLFGASTTTTAPQAGGLFGSPAPAQPQAGGLFGPSTSQAQSGGLFGSAASTAQSQSGGLFGSTATTSQPQTGGLFGSSTNTQPQTGGLFGSSTTTSQPQTGGLFGSTAATSQPQGGATSGWAATTSQPTQSGGLLGPSAGTSKLQTGGLCGSALQHSSGPFGNMNTSQAALSGGMFANAGPGQTQNIGTGLIGNTSTQPAQNGGLFSNTQNQQSQQSGSGLFGSLGQSQQQNQQQGGLQSGQSNNQQQQTVPGVRIDTANIRGTTRFNDLHDELQKQIDHLDAVIQQQIKIKNDINAILPAHDNGLANIPNDVEFCRRKLIGLEAAMSSDADSVRNVQKLVTEDIEHAKLSFRAADNLRLPAQYHIPGVWQAKSSTNDSRSQNGNSEAQRDIVGYFSSTADDLSSTLSKYQKNINEIELHLRNVEATSAQQVASVAASRKGGSASDDDAVRELASALADFEQGILHVAGKVGGARETVQTLQLGEFTDPSKSATSRHRSGIY